MKKLWVLIIVLLLGIQAFPQKIFVVENRYEADLTIYFVINKFEADIWIYNTPNKYEAQGNTGLWCFVYEKSEADKRVFVTNNRANADILVYTVNEKYNAGWRANTPKSKRNLIKL